MITTIITTESGTHTNASPIDFTITFSTSVIGLTEEELVIDGGTILNFTGSGATRTVTILPNEQGSIVTIFVPAGVATDSPVTESNEESNTVSVIFDATSPSVALVHLIDPVTDRRKLPISFVFDRAVTGIDISDITTDNATITDLTGSGDTYYATLNPLSPGLVSLYVNEGAATDLFGNTSAQSETLTFYFDAVTPDYKDNLIGGTISDPNTLVDFTVDELNEIVDITSIQDCVKNIPQRLMELAQAKLFDLVMQQPSARDLVAKVQVVESSIGTITNLVEDVQTAIKNPETLMASILEATGLTGQPLTNKLATIANTFGAVDGLNSIMNAARASGVCGQLDYYADGSIVPAQTLTPTDTPPPAILGVPQGVFSTYDSTIKDEYDEFAFRLKESFEIGDLSEQESDRAQMMTIVMTLGMSYHDDIAQTIDASNDATLYDKYLNNVERERANNPGWSDAIKESYAQRTNDIGQNINRSAQVIRNFINRNQPLIGEVVSVGATTYSGPDKDFTTFLDIKPSERPPELTQYWASKRNIAAATANMEARGMPTGTLSYSDAFNGAYGPLVSDKTVASTRFPGGSIIALKNPDGTVYDPTGKNPSGQYTVTDTGNTERTFNKVDIFTSMPELYKGLSAVHVYLIKEGNQKGSKYRNAVAQYGRGY